MNTFILFVTCSPTSTRQVRNALSFAKAAIENGDAIQQVFFYAESVVVANHCLKADTASDNVHKQWCKLSRELNLRLNVCVTASLKRAVLGAEEAEYADMALTIDPSFHQVGMAEYFAVLKDTPDIISVQF